MTLLNAGQLDREIVLQRGTFTQSASGQETIDWDSAERVRVWAQWLPADTRESWQAQRRFGAYIDGVYQIYFREEPRPDTTRIIGHDGRIYDLKGAMEIGRMQGWLLAVVARAE